MTLINKIQALSLMMIVLVIAMSSCSTESEVGVEQPTAVKVEVQKIKSTNKAKELQFTGIIEADDKLVLSTKMVGQITNVLVKEGDKINRGQLLVKINSNEIQSKLKGVNASLSEAKASLANVKRNYERIKILAEKGSATQSELDDITTSKKVGEAKVVSIQESKSELYELLTYANLKSPISGFVSQKFVNVGDMATPGSPLLALESLDKLKASINVPEFEIGMLEENDPVQVKIDAIPNRAYRGLIEKIIPSTAFSGAQYKVNIAFESLDRDVKPGMFARVNIKKNLERKILIPESAIQRRGQLHGIFTVNQQGEAMLRWVRIGETYPEGTEVLSGLSQDEIIIVLSEAKLYDGMKIEIIKSI